MQNSPWSSTAVPSRPAPAPPPPSSIAANSTHRYTPTTNWDDSPFETAESHQSRKVPPPRPPPPRVQPSPVESTWSNSNGAKSKVLGIPFKKATPQSVNILSNLFGSRSGGSSSGSKTQVLKLPPPPPALKKTHHHTNVQATTRVSTVPLQSSAATMSMPTGAPTASELIDWSSPPSSPTLTHKTFNSDCISVDSFSSETHSNSSPQNGSYYSQAESGFEDDFSVHSQTTSSSNGFQQDSFRKVSNQITLMDPFSAPPLRSEIGPAKIRQVPPPIAQKPKIVEQSAFYPQNNSISFQPSSSKPFDDPLSNGKCLIPPVANTVSMPTIIKPVIMAKPVGLGQKDRVMKVNVNVALPVPVVKRDQEVEKTPSPPMPIYAPPPPPPEYYAIVEAVGLDDEVQESYGIALYDYESEHEGDLNLREGDKIYLVRQETADWMYGRSKRGCEGLFPVNYVDIKVPLKSPVVTNKISNINQQGPNYAPTTTIKTMPKVVEEPVEQRRCRALYDFNAEAEEDLSITEGEIITVVEEINAEWLMGRKKNGMQGQFPAAFVEYL